MKLHLKQNISQTRILLEGVLIPILLNNRFTSCSLINFYFLLPHIAHFDNIIDLLFLGFENLRFVFPVFFLHFTLLYT